MQRPLSLSIVGWFLIVMSLFGIFSLFTLASNPTAAQMLAQSPLPLWAHQAIAVIGVVVGVASGYGVLKGFNWSRYLYIGWSIIAILLQLVTTSFTSLLILSVLFIAIFAFFLFRPPANAWFNRASAVNEAA